MKDLFKVDVFLLLLDAEDTIDEGADKFVLEGHLRGKKADFFEESMEEYEREAVHVLWDDAEIGFL